MGEQIVEKIKRVFDDFDVVTFLEQHNVKYDEWLKSQVFQLLGAVERDVLKILEGETQFSSEQGLLEYLASLEHKQWIKWSKDISNKEKLSRERLQRWKRFWKPYSELSEEAKEFDREWARKVLTILKIQLVFEKEQWRSSQHEKLQELISEFPEKGGYHRIYEWVEKLKKFAEFGTKKEK